MTYDFGSGKDDGQSKGWDDNACREEDGQLFAGIAGRVRVVNQPPRNAVRDGGKDVEEEDKQRPVFAAEGDKIIRLDKTWLTTLLENDYKLQNTMTTSLFPVPGSNTEPHY